MADIIPGPNSSEHTNLDEWINKVYSTISVSASPIIPEEGTNNVVGGVCEFTFDRNQCGAVLVELIESVKKGEVGSRILMP